MTPTLQDKSFYAVMPDTVKAARNKLRELKKPLTEAYNKQHAEELESIRSRLKIKDTETYRLAWMEMRAFRSRAEREFLKDPEYKAAYDAYQAIAPTVNQRQEKQFPYVVLNNGLVEIAIAPTIGMRVFNAIDLTTGRSIAASDDPRQLETEQINNGMGWFAGYSEVSYPSPEHGTNLENPAGWRIIEHEDGSVSVAMNMRFTSYQHQRHMARYGHYAQRPVSQWVTLKPGESKYTVTYRVDNPTGTRRGSRVWVNHVMYTRAYDEKHLLFPIGYYMFHNSQWVGQYHAGPKENRTYLDVSWFGLDPDYNFCGVYDPKHNANALIIKEDKDPGMKLYTPRVMKDGFLEFWIGSTYVFEDPGTLQAPYIPIQLTTTHYVAGGIGRCDFANEHVAIGFDQGGFKLMTPTVSNVTVTDFSGNILSQGKAAPDKMLSGTGQQLKVYIDQRMVAQLSYPLQHSDVTELQPIAGAMGGTYRAEAEAISSFRTKMNSQHAFKHAEILLASEDPDPEFLISTAKTLFRYGRFDLVRALLKKAAPSPHADYLQGLMAWEEGKPVDFKTAGLDAHYHRAMLEIQNKDITAAIQWLNALINERPDVYRPRLMLAYLNKDMQSAKVLSKLNPGSLEALLVLELLGDDNAIQAKQDLLRQNTDAAEHLSSFKGEITEGKWLHPRRYELLTKPLEK